MRAAVNALPAELTATQLLGTGPWVWRGAGGGGGEGTEDWVKTGGGFYFLRGGFMATPWGSARWGAARGEGVSQGGKLSEPLVLPAPHPAAPLVLYLCGADKWTHGISLVQGSSTVTVVRLTSRSTGEVQDLHLSRKVAAAAAPAAGGSGTGLGLLEAPHPSGDTPPPSEVAEVAAALLAKDQPLAVGPDALAAAVRRQRLQSWGRGPCNPSHARPAALSTRL